MTTTERFLSYIRIPTQSDEASETTPSSARQLKLAEMLAAEMRGMGISDAYVDRLGYVYGHLPATRGLEDVTPIGFIAHMDTSPDFCGEGVNPQIIPAYDGSAVKLGDSGRVLDPTDFPHLRRLSGRTLITTDGKTLLGADDKAGIAEIMTMAERLITEKIPHGPISIGFTPDEEVGRGADHFDISGFAAKYAYTVDGGEECEIVWENFNAAAAEVEISGFNVHPGSAKDTMVNAVLAATEFAAMLPSAETPRHTELYEGFYHLCSIEGGVEWAKMRYIIRDHSSALFAAKKATMRLAAKRLNERYGEGTVKLTIRDSYQNMEEMIRPCMFVVDYAKAAIRKAGLEPLTDPIRGGTDGARLSFSGLPCPNLGTGGYAYHGPYEHITAEGLEKSTEILLGIAEQFAADRSSDR